MNTTHKVSWSDLKALLLVAMVAAVLGCAPVPSTTPQKDDAAVLQPTPFDGVWRLGVNQKLYRISAGRMWVEEPVQVGAVLYQPGQVVVQGIQQTGPTTLEGWDIALSGNWEMTLADGSVTVTTRSLIPFSGSMESVALDFPVWYERQINTASILPPTSAAVVANDVKQDGSLDIDALGAYHALIIGNAAYNYIQPLETSLNDARALSTVLHDDYGFEVELLEDATRAETLRALRRYREELNETDNLLIYYAGHGWLDSEADEGFWLPVDAEQDSDVNWISNSTITNYLKSIKAKHVMVVADSCYSGTLTRGLNLSVKSPGYLDRMAAMRARIVLSSGGLEPVTDEGGDGHSAFARSLLEVLRDNQGVIDSTSLYSELRRPVMLRADQAPELADIRKAGHEGGDFLFVRQ